MYGLKIQGQDKGNTNVKVFFFYDQWKKIMIGMKFRQNLCYFLFSSLAVTRVLPEFSSRSISLLNYNFYITTRPNFLGVLEKRIEIDTFPGKVNEN